MAYMVADRVAESSTTTGTGDLTLAGALTGYQTFNATVGVNGTCYYLIEAVDGSGAPTGAWETGVGKLTGSTTLQRLAFLASSTGSAVSFAAGTKYVHLVAPARQLGFSGGIWYRSTNDTARNFTGAGASIPWDGELFSTEFTSVFHESVTNPSRVTLDGSRYADAIVRLSAQVKLQNITSGEVVTLMIKDDLGTIIGQKTEATATTTPIMQVQSQIYSMSTTTRYFEVHLATAADSSVDVVGAAGGQTSWFQLEVLQ
jgi:hypothetical protein